MKKLRLMAIRSNKDALLKELICKGCVEFSEIEGEVQDSDFKELLKRESSGLMTFKSQHMALVNAVGILDRYSPAKKPLLSALPEVGEDVLLDDGGVGAALAAADEISANEYRIKSNGAEVGRLENTIELLSIESIKRCVAANIGVSYLPRFAVAKELECGELIELPFGEQSQTITAMCAHHAGKAVSPAMHTFIQCVEESFVAG